MHSVAFTPDARGLVSGSLDKRLKCWDVSRLAGGQGGQQVSPGASKRNPLNGKDEVGNGSACTMGLTGHRVNDHTRRTDRPEEASDRLAQDYVISVAVSHDGKWVVSGSRDRGAVLWDAETGIPQLVLHGHKNTGRLSPPDLTPQVVRKLTVLPF